MALPPLVQGMKEEASPLQLEGGEKEETPVDWGVHHPQAGVLR